jgi:hypothetical protein
MNAHTLSCWASGTITDHRTCVTRDSNPPCATCPATLNSFSNEQTNNTMCEEFARRLRGDCDTRALGQHTQMLPAPIQKSESSLSEKSTPHRLTLAFFSQLVNAGSPHRQSKLDDHLTPTDVDYPPHRSPTPLTPCDLLQFRNLIHHHRKTSTHPLVLAAASPLGTASLTLGQ